MKKINKNDFTPLPKHGVIDKPGNYYLEHDFISNNMFAIKIECNNVTLDLNTHNVVTNNPGSHETTFGIYALEQEDISVFNGNIYGASIGVHAAYTDNFSAYMLHINSCTHMGMNIGGAFASVKHCLIRNIGGQTNEAYAIGINSSDAKSAHITLNKISNIYRQRVPREMIGEGVGILLGHDTKACVVGSNTATNDSYEPHTYSIWAVGEDHLIDTNILCDFQYGVYMGNSDLFDNIIMLRKKYPETFAISGGMGKCRNNDIINYDTEYNYKLQEDVTKNIPFVLL